MHVKMHLYNACATSVVTRTQICNFDDAQSYGGSTNFQQRNPSCTTFKDLWAQYNTQCLDVMCENNKWDGEKQ